MDQKTPEVFLLFSVTKAVMLETFLKAVIKNGFSLKLLHQVQTVDRDIPVILTLEASHAHYYTLYC